MSTGVVVCAYCGLAAEKESRDINRAKKKGMKLYCGRTCAGLGRRRNRSDAEKKEAKRQYDMEYRRKNAGRLRAEKSAYFQRTYDPAKAAVDRKKRAKAHVAYCRRPEYRAWKRGYDRQHRAKKYGEFWESYLLILDLNKEITSRASRYDVYAENGTLNKALRRKRDYEKTHSQEPQGRPLGNIE